MSTSTRTPTWIKSNLKTIAAWAILLIVAVALAATNQWWLPHAQQWLSSLSTERSDSDISEETEDGSLAIGNGEIASIELSEMAMKSLQLKTGVLTPGEHTEFVSVPAMVVERPGRSQLEITTCMTGSVNKIYFQERQFVKPGSPLFRMHLTHEDVVTAQSEFLKATEQLEIMNDELNRLKDIGAGVIPGKRIVEQTYERDKAAAAHGAMRQSLLLHGLSEAQVSNIEKTRELLHEFEVVAPDFEIEAVQGDRAHEHLFHLQSVNVNRGQAIEAGETLGLLADHSLLFVEGQAFEEDAERLIQAAAQQELIRVMPLSSDDEPPLMLQVQSVSDKVEQKSRALKFYLVLPNELVNSRELDSLSEGEFVAWRFRPGQRMEVRIPSSITYHNQFILPLDAVAFDEPNAYIFEQNGDHFDRIEVQVLHRDKSKVVVARDPRLVGSVIAMSSAHRLNLAIKNQSGSGVDPHAGHTH